MTHVRNSLVFVGIAAVCAAGASVAQEADLSAEKAALVALQAEHEEACGAEELSDDARRVCSTTRVDLLALRAQVAMMATDIMIAGHEDVVAPSAEELADVRQAVAELGAFQRTALADLPRAEPEDGDDAGDAADGEAAETDEG